MAHDFAINWKVGGNGYIRRQTSFQPENSNSSSSSVQVDRDAMVINQSSQEVMLTQPLLAASA